MKIFISYAWKGDQPFVERLYNDLQTLGYDPWMDKEKMPSRGRSLVICLLNTFTVHWVVEHIRRFHPGSRVQDSRAWLHMGFEAVFCRNNR